MSVYEKFGVSSTKNGVFNAIKVQGGGEFSGAFCKIVPNVFENHNDMNYIALHADGVGTKSIIAYLDYVENKNILSFYTLAKDAIAMNLNDLLCIGSCGPFIMNNIINRNKIHIPNSVLEIIMQGYQDCANELMNQFGIEIVFCGGETADIGDIVRTITIDANACCKISNQNIIDNTKIQPDNVIIGISSTGKTKYEKAYNSGISSNGLTLARRVLLSSCYNEYPEIFDEDVGWFIGKYMLDDHIPKIGNLKNALLSPTRIYAPIIKPILEEYRYSIFGMVHCTGGGQTKCLNIQAPVNIVKNNMFDVPPIFELIRKTVDISYEEMYRVFNMGHLIELFVDPKIADEIVNRIREFGIEAKIIGYCTETNLGGPWAHKLTIKSPEGHIVYDKEKRA
jgi:phosphoribosylformylglycinamidine cyclo-ligase